MQKSLGKKLIELESNLRRKLRKASVSASSSSQVSADVKVEKRVNFTHILQAAFTSSGVDPTKLFFFANEEFFRFLLVSLHFYYIQKKNY